MALPDEDRLFQAQGLGLGCLGMKVPDPTPPQDFLPVFPGASSMDWGGRDVLGAPPNKEKADAEFGTTQNTTISVS